MKKIFLLLFSLPLLFALPARASHILGGELRMEATGQPNQYDISMIQYWDKTKLTLANQDPWVELLFYRKRDNALIYKNKIPLLSTEKVAYQNDICTQFRSLDSQVGTYKATVSLNPGDFNDSDGYYIVWERCCRNAAIGNIRSPGESGLVFYLEFPPLSLRNSSPVFNGPNGDYICKDVAYSTNASATDADGDELRYSLVTPLRGNTTMAAPDGTDSPKAGYPPIDWSGASSAQNAIPGNPSLSIDARTGQLTVTANQLGLFVFTVLCEEFRNGQRIGAVRRDYQSLVIECNPPPPMPVVTQEGQTVKTVVICENTSTVLEIQQPGDWLYQWNRDGQSVPGATNPRLEVREAGNYTVNKSPKDKQCTGTALSEVLPVTVVKPPTATIDPSENALCEGGSLELKGNDKDSYVYEWRRNADILAENGSILSVNQAGNYSLLVRDKASGCTATASTEVKLENISIDLPSQISILRGESVVLKPVIKSISTSLRYAWSPPTGLDSPTAAQPVASPTQNISYILKVITSGGCVASDTVLVQVIECSNPPVPIVVLNGNAKETIEFCPERPISLKIKEPGDWAYQWRLNGTDIGGATSTELTAISIGKYSVIRKFKKNELCALNTLSSTVNLTLGTKPVATILGAEKALCPGGRISLSTNNDSSFSYEWRFRNTKLSTTNASISVEKEGQYSVTVTNEINGCTTRDSTTVKLDTTQVPIPDVLYKGNLPQTIEFCSGGSATLEAKNPGNWAYQWYLNGREIQGATSSIISARETGNYTLSRILTDSGSCAKPAFSQPVLLSVGKTPSAAITKSKDVICAGESLELTAEDDSSYAYEWVVNSRKTEDTGFKLIAEQAGLYRLKVVDTKNDCSATDSLLVTEEVVNVDLPDKLVVRRGESVALNPLITSSAQPLAYLWTPSSGLDNPNESQTKAFPTENISYVLQVSTPGGCAATDTVSIIVVDRIYVPDAFSPNGDGTNDFLIIQNGEQLIETIRIYDRWGTVVFSSLKYEMPWDGSFKNAKVSPGIYTYVIKTSFESFKGSIVVIF